MIELNTIVEKLGLTREAGGFSKTRYNKDEWSMDTMLQAVVKLGRTIDPRFVIDDDNRSLYTNIVYWVMNDDRMTCTDPYSGKEIRGRLGKGIYIAGNTGSGKSVAMTILRRLERLNPRRMKEDTPGIIYEGRDYFTCRADEITDAFSRNGEVERVKKAFSLAIQDLGSEPSETVYMGNRINVMRSILEYRGDVTTLQTFVTSNIPMGHPDLRARYGERSVSRMVEMMNYLTLTGNDRRLNY